MQREIRLMDPAFHQEEKEDLESFGFSLRYQTRHSLTSTYLFALPSLAFMLPT